MSNSTETTSKNDVKRENPFVKMLKDKKEMMELINAGCSIKELKSKGFNIVNVL